MKTTVRSLADDLDIWDTFIQGVAARLDAGRDKKLIDRVGILPVRSSHAVGLLGSYVHRGGEPIGIRLQPRQEVDQLRVTLLHELAHACDHLSAEVPHRHRCTHGPGWRSWALAFRIAPVRCGHSPALAELRKARLKPVAVCERCGCVFHRLRRLPRRRSWLHPDCGNGRVVPLPVHPGGK